MFKNNLLNAAVKDLEDARDLRYFDIVGNLIEEDLPNSFELDISGMKIKNQYLTSSCGCQASSMALGMQFKSNLSAKYAFKVIKTDPEYPSSSLKWGQYTRDAAKIPTRGICLEEYCLEANTGSDKSYLDFQITDLMVQNASKHKADLYIRIDNLFGNDFDIVKHFIYREKKPVIIAMPWYKNYNDAKKTGIVQNGKGSNVGHIVLCYGWIDFGYKCIQSLGNNWGENGTFVANKLIPTWDVWGIIKNDEIVKPIIRHKRKVELEKYKAKEMQDFLYRRLAPYDKARSIAGKEWLLIVQAITYRGYSYTDIVNYCYAKSRQLDIPFNLNKHR